MSDDEYGTLTVGQNDDGTLHVVGDVPDRLLVSPEIHAIAGNGASESLSLSDEVLTIKVAPEPLRYRVVGFDLDKRAYQCQRDPS